jgi:hypothetical protein
MPRALAKALFVARAWIFSFAFLLAVGWVVTSSKPFQACIKQHQQSGAAENFEQSISAISIALGIYRDCLGGFTHDNAEAIIAAFTIILSLSTIFLWVATRDLVSGSERTAERQLRAYIVADGTDMDPKQPGQFISNIAIRNTGQTPAHNLSIITRTCVLLHPPGPEVDFSIGAVENPSNIVLGAGRKIGTSSRLSRHDVTMEEFTDAVSDNGHTRIYTYGKVTYTDVFDDRQWTNFCFYFQWSGSEKVEAIASEYHNEAS